MYKSDFPSQLLENAVEEFAKLPGIGRKTALRLTLHILKQKNEDVNLFGQTFIKLKNEVKFCKICNNVSDKDICNICSDNTRDKSVICVVENIKDVMAIENTSQFKGNYHVLSGIISPMDGIGPSDLNIQSLENRIRDYKEIKEIIFALPTTMEGDTTNYYIHKKINNYNLKFSVLARGVAVGDELEYTDELTLGRSILNRTVFNPNL
jgi:recombination protein RecR